jgi:signal transduction histidine kinase
MFGIWRVRLFGEAGEHRATPLGASYLVAPIGASRQMPGNRDPVNILLVDDQASKLLSYEVILEELGENLIKTTSGKEALEFLLRNEVAVIVVDVSMPELDGFELAAMIREHPRFTRTAIIFVSAIHLSEIDSLRGYQAGAVDYLPVPIVPELLRAKVRVFSELYRKTRELEELNAELEKRVAERTAELAAANADLEIRVEARTREREEALAKVAGMQKLESLGQLTGGFAHDFNNLLMVIQGSLELARRHAKGEERLSVLLGRATEAVERGAALTKRMLAFARRQDLKPENISLSDVVHEMAEMISRSLDPIVRIIVDIPADLPPVRIDRNQFELALLNLALNARDAMPSGGTLTISATSKTRTPDKLDPGSFVQLSVADNGLGMDADTLKRALEPFFTTKPVGKGSGLGLSMVHGLILQSHGTMQIMSRPNEGTVVSLWLPVVQDHASKGSAPSPANVSPKILPCQVLLVDDDQLILATTAEMLRELGHEPIAISSAIGALEFLQANDPPDLAILDYAMPEMTGARLADRIRETCPTLPLILASGYSAGSKARADLHTLDKPYTMLSLSQVIGLLAGRHVKSPS